MSETDVLLTAATQLLIFFGVGIFCAEVIGRLGFFRISSKPLKIVLLLIFAVIMLTSVALFAESGVYPFSTSPRTAPGNCTAAFLVWLIFRSRRKSSVPVLKKGYGRVICPTCGFNGTVKEYLSWKKNGKQGNRGKLPSGHIVIACPECDTEIRWDSLTGNVDGVIDHPTADVNVGGDKGVEANLYEMAVEEVSGGKRSQGLWAKALAETSGDQESAHWRYLQLRVETLKEERSRQVRRTAVHVHQTLAEGQQVERLDKRNRILDELSSALLIVLLVASVWFAYKMLQAETDVSRIQFIFGLVVISGLITGFGSPFVAGLIWLLRGEAGRERREIEIQKRKQKEKEARRSIARNLIKLIFVVAVVAAIWSLISTSIYLS